MYKEYEKYEAIVKVNTAYRVTRAYTRPKVPYIHANSKAGFLGCYPLFLLHCERVDHLHDCDLSGRQLTRVGEPALGQRTGLITICMVVSCLAGIGPAYD